MFPPMPGVPPFVQLPGMPPFLPMPGVPGLPSQLPDTAVRPEMLGMPIPLPPQGMPISPEGPQGCDGENTPGMPCPATVAQTVPDVDAPVEILPLDATRTLAPNMSGNIGSISGDCNQNEMSSAQELPAEVALQILQAEPGAPVILEEPKQTENGNTTNCTMCSPTDKPTCATLRENISKVQDVLRDLRSGSTVDEMIERAIDRMVETEEETTEGRECPTQGDGWLSLLFFREGGERISCPKESTRPKGTAS